MNEKQNIIDMNLEQNKKKNEFYKQNKNENKRLFDENAKLKAELDAFRNKKDVKKLKKVDK